MMDKLLDNKTVLKVVAFIIAIMLWLVVSIDQQSGADFTQTEDQVTMDNVAVEVLYDDELYEIVEMEEAVQLVLSGRRALLNLNMLRSEPYKVYADLREYGAGEHRVQLEYEGFPSELDVDIVPDHMTVVLEKKEFRSFDVEVELTGNAAEGFIVGEPQIEPEQVHVIAPLSVLDRVAIVRGFINLDAAEDTVEEEVDLRVYAENGTELPAEISPGSVRVEIPVEGANVRVPLNLEIDPQMLPDNVSIVDIENEVDEVQVYGDEQALEEISSIKPEVDLSGVDESQTVSVDIPVNEEWEGADPESVDVEVEVGPTRERLFSNIPIQVTGLDDEQDLSFLDPADGEVTLSVYGSQQRLNQLDSTDIQVSIDVANLKQGEHEVSAKISVPQYLTYAPEGIDVRIRLDGPEEQRQGAAEQQQETAEESDGPGGRNASGERDHPDEPDEPDESDDPDEPKEGQADETEEAHTNDEDTGVDETGSE